MNKLYKVEDIVREILTEYKSTRSNDFELIVRTYNKINPSIVNYSFSSVMMSHKELGLPYFETIRRTRQKLQAQNEELRPSKEVQIARTNKESDYINYALDKLN